MIATQPGWGGVIAGRVLVELAIATVILRVLVAGSSMHVHRVVVQRVTSAAVGSASRRDAVDGAQPW